MSTTAKSKAGFWALALVALMVFAGSLDMSQQEQDRNANTHPATEVCCATQVNR